MLVAYVRDPKRQDRFIGCVVAVGAEAVGWSQCCSRDTFSKELGKRIATGRALSGSDPGTKIVEDWSDKDNSWKDFTIQSNTPNQFVKAAMIRMAERAKKYFKEDYAG